MKTEQAVEMSELEAVWRRIDDHAIKLENKGLVNKARGCLEALDILSSFMEAMRQRARIE